MPEKETLRRAARDKQEGKAFVREEIHHIREGKHGARSTKQAIAIALSKARRAGVDLPDPRKGTVSERTRRSAVRDRAKGRSGPRAVSRRRSRATAAALAGEGHGAGSHAALAKQAHTAARRRGPKARSAAAAKAVATKGARARSAAARKAARTRARKRARG